jgi:hypothetical protein
VHKSCVRFGWLAAAAGLLLAGCQSSGGYPREPLLASKRPVKGNPESPAQRTQLADAEPQAPGAPPTEALAAIPTGNERAASLGFPTGSVLRPSQPTTSETPPANNPPFQTAVRTRQQVQAIPAVRTRDAGTAALLQATPATRQNTPGPNVGGTVMYGSLGHDAQYTWIQGVVEKHYHGRIYLRYCDPSVEDPHGGKVCLDHDPSLEQFKEGDVIRVEGTISHEPDPSRHAGWQHFPHYHVQSARLIQRAQ